VKLALIYKADKTFNMAYFGVQLITI